MKKFELPTEVDFFRPTLKTDGYKVFESCNGQKEASGKTDTYSESETEKHKMGNNLFSEMKGFLILGRIIGIVPVSGVFSNSDTNLAFSVFSVPTIICVLVSSIIFITVVLAVINTISLPKANALQIATSIQGTIFKLWALFNCLYFLLRADSFINIFNSWRRSSLANSSRDKTLRRDIILISTVVLAVSVLESAIIHMEYFPQLDYVSGHDPRTTTGKSTLEIYYERSHWEWKMNLGYHPFLAVLAFASHKFTIACWNYVDLTIILFARALYFRFKALYEFAEEILSSQRELGQNRLTWASIVKDHDTLCELLESFEKFLSPLIFGSYMTNIYYICMQLTEGLSPARVDHSLIHSIFAPLSFFSLLMRVFLISNTAAKVHTYAHDIGHTFKKCPIEYYDAEVSRVDKHVTSGPDIGLTGLGCFTVTKPFMLNLINIIFTIEIVLLQGITTASNGSCPVPVQS